MEGGLLASFWIEFKSDATKLVDGTKKTKKAAEDAAKGLATVDKISQSLGGKFKKLAEEYGALITAAIGLYALKQGFTSAKDYADNLNKLSTALGVSVEDLGLWGDAVRSVGGTAEGFQGTVQALSDDLATFVTNGTSNVAPFFHYLGVEMTTASGKARDIFEILPELADSFSKLGHSEATSIGKRMGLDPGTILLLQKGRKEVDEIIKRQKELGVVTKQDAEIASKFNQAWDDMTHAFRGLFTTVGSSVLPALTAIVESFTNVAQFFKKHSHFITGAMIVLGGAILGFVVPPLLAAAAAALALYAPFLLIGAVIAATTLVFSLLYDEVMNFFEGNESYLGDIIRKWSSFGEAIRKVKDDVVEFFEKLSGAYEKVKNFLGFGGDATVNATSQIEAADSNPFNSQTSQGITNSNQSRSSSNNVSIGEVSVNTAATDGLGISRDIGAALMTQINQSITNFDDGIAA